MFDLRKYLDEKTGLINGALERYLPPETSRPIALHKAMRYSVMAGGKRLRPILCLAAANACGGSDEVALLPALSIEVLHTYTLIHDDLPCMDDDDLRRGKPTCHVVFGEANAVLAGDALLTLAFEWLAGAPEALGGFKQDGDATPADTSRRLGQACCAPYYPDRPASASRGPTLEADRVVALRSDLILELARAAGSMGVVGGQAEDLGAEGKKPDADLVEFIHLRKTAVLIRAAVRMGGMCAMADERELEALSVYGTKAGLAFQIADDVLNETSSAEQLGKAVGSDRARGKMTYVAVHGLAKSKEMADKLAGEAKEALKAIKGDAEPLAALVDHIVTRKV